jgi:hypothetical protein
MFSGFQEEDLERKLTRKAAEHFDSLATLAVPILHYRCCCVRIVRQPAKKMCGELRRSGWENDRRGLSRGAQGWSPRRAW